jgi:hypothetical protein
MDDAGGIVAVIAIVGVAVGAFWFFVSLYHRGGP